MQITKCKITGLPVENLETGNNIYYTVNYNGKDVDFSFCRQCYNKKGFEDNKDIILSLLLNDRIYGNNYIDRAMHWYEADKSPDKINLYHIIREGVYPRSPKEKLDNLYKELFALQTYDGEKIPILDFVKNEYSRLYFKNKTELKHYIYALKENGIIEVEENADAGYMISIKFTYKGLMEYIDLFESGFNSLNCFIAMSFDKSEKSIKTRIAIKEALVETGFVPILVDEKDIDSDKTINDEIIHLLRDCKFCIADFTGQKSGVYFESGFALGQGKPVIYTCEEEDFKKSHFDIKPLQHIIYKTAEELKEALIHKIKAWIQ